MKLRINGAAKYQNTIIAMTEDGDWILKHRFPGRDHPQLYATLKRVDAVGEIDTTYWTRKRYGRG